MFKLPQFQRYMFKFNKFYFLNPSRQSPIIVNYETYFFLSIYSKLKIGLNLIKYFS